MKTKRLWALLVLFLLLSGCGTGSQEDADDDSDAFLNDIPATGLAIRNAQNFDIRYLADGVKALTDSAGRELLLMPEGANAPEGYENAMKVTTPIRRAMFTSAAQVSFLGELKDDSLYDSIAAVTTEPYQWTIPQMTERFASGQITYVVQDSWTWGDMEGIVAAAPDLVFVDISGENGAALCTILDAWGIPYVVAVENRDHGPEAYLEWLKFFGAFYNLDDAADSIYRGKMDYLDGLYGKAASVPENEKPVVAYGMVYEGIVYTQGGQSSLARQLERAGAVYALEDLDGDGQVQLGMEEFLDKCQNADVLIYNAQPMYMQGSLLYEDPLFAEFKAYQTWRVYTLDNGYYMNSAKVVERFEDILAICHPELEEGHVFTGYQPLQNY